MRASVWDQFAKQAAGRQEAGAAVVLPDMAEGSLIRMGQIRLDDGTDEKVRRWISGEGWTQKALNQLQYEMDEEYMECVRDILGHPIFQSMDQYIQHGDTTCRDHCIKVSYLSYRISRRFGWDCRTTARAALLHDLFLYDWHTHARETGEYFHGFTHPRVAMNNAVKYFQVGEMERNLILCHMWPLTLIPPRYREGYAIVYADKYCGVAEIAGRMRDRIAYRAYPKLSSWDGGMRKTFLRVLKIRQS